MTTASRRAGRLDAPSLAIRPRPIAIQASEVLALLGAGALLVSGTWVVHGGLAMTGSAFEMATALGQLTALLGTYVALAGIVLAARVPWIDAGVGSDRLRAWHRVAGFACLWLLIAHTVATSAGWALGGGSDALAELVGLLTTWDVLLATVGLALLVLVAVTSVRAARRRLAWETWYGLHLYAYLGIALAFLHQVTLGTDLVDDPVAMATWIGLYVVTFGLLIGYRVVAPIRLTLRHRPRVAAVVTEGPGIASLYVTGRHLERIPVRAGQWFQLRVLRGGGWWRPHPFSISAAPDGRSLRFTVKDLGDDSHRLLGVPTGTRLFLEGPYGALGAASVTRDEVVMIAGGIGITPLRAILEELPWTVRTTLLVRVADPADAIFASELAALAADHPLEVRVASGHRTCDPADDPISPAGLLAAAPDIRSADVLVCGSAPFTDRVLQSLRWLGVPRGRIHAERFD